MVSSHLGLWECGDGLQPPSAQSEHAPHLGWLVITCPILHHPSARGTLGLLDGSIGRDFSTLRPPDFTWAYLLRRFPASSGFLLAGARDLFLSFLDFFFFPFNSCLPLQTRERVFYLAEHGKQGESFLPVYICLHNCFILQHHGAF